MALCIESQLNALKLSPCQLLSKSLPPTEGQISLGRFAAMKRRVNTLASTTATKKSPSLQINYLACIWLQTIETHDDDDDDDDDDDVDG